jgi:hypothetical protein
MAAKTKTTSSISFNKKPRKKRPGVHAKSKSSKIKTSKNYIKQYISQGK